MSKPIWMPLNPGDYLKDTMHLDTAEHGAYLLLLMQAWVRGGSLPNDQEQLRRMTRMSPEQWAASSATLLAFFTDAGAELRHKRIDADLAKAQAFRDEQARKSRLAVEARVTRGLTRGSPVGEPVDNPVVDPRVTQTQSQSQQLKTRSPIGDPKESRTRGSRLPDDFQPGEGTPEQIAEQLPILRDYWIAQPGQKGVKLDWQATWRNWLRRASTPRPGTAAPKYRNGFLQLIEEGKV